MKIQKYVKDKQNKYKVIIDDEQYVLYDDVIIKYGLLMKTEITSEYLNEIVAYNDQLKSYYESIKYINKKLRSEKEVREYLIKKEISNDIINNTLKKLKETGYINNEMYLKAYISDQINLSNNGPKKIIKNLIKLGLNEEDIYDKVNDINESIWNDKIEKYIEKKIKTNHNSSSTMLKIKITNDLINLGYEKENILPILNRYTISDRDIYQTEYEKAKRQLSKKYEGYELERKIKERLYRKGFKSYGDVSYEE